VGGLCFGFSWKGRWEAVDARFDRVYFSVPVHGNYMGIGRCFRILDHLFLKRFISSANLGMLALAVLASFG
jgi:hypothetical protein